MFIIQRKYDTSPQKSKIMLVLLEAQNTSTPLIMQSLY
jgi:hypothetical protein